MTDLQINEWVLDGFVFGGMRKPGTNNIFVSSVDPGGKGATTAGDTARAGQDGIALGIDTVSGPVITLGLVVNGDATNGRDTYNYLQSLWVDDRNRMTPEAMSALSMNLKGSIPLRVYGRPRDFGPNGINYLANGLIETTATFQMADSLFYSEALHSEVISVIPPNSLQAQILNSNYDFETGTQAWTPSGGTFEQSDDEHYAGSYSGLFTPDGITASPEIVSDTFNVVSGGRYHFGVWVRPTQDQTVYAGIRYYDAASALITTVDVAQLCGNGTWTKAIITDLAPENAVKASAVIRFDGTPVFGTFLDEARLQELPGISPPIRPPLRLAGTGNRPSGIKNSGTLPTWPVFTFNGPCTNPSVNYSGTNRHLEIKTTLRRGESIAVDTHPWARTIVRNDGASLAGKAYGSRLSDLALYSGTTIVAYRAQDNTGLSSLTVDWRDAYATP